MLNTNVNCWRADGCENYEHNYHSESREVDSCCPSLSTKYKPCYFPKANMQIYQCVSPAWVCYLLSDNSEHKDICVCPAHPWEHRWHTLPNADVWLCNYGNFHHWLAMMTSSDTGLRLKIPLRLAGMFATVPLSLVLNAVESICYPSREPMPPPHILKDGSSKSESSLKGRPAHWNISTAPTYPLISVSVE